MMVCNHNIHSLLYSDVIGKIERVIWLPSNFYYGYLIDSILGYSSIQDGIFYKEISSMLYASITQILLPQ